MDLAIDDFFADLSGQTSSAGVSSLLRHCIGDEVCGEVDSGCAGCGRSAELPEALSPAMSTAQGFVQMKAQPVQIDNGAPAMAPLLGFSAPTCSFERSTVLSASVCAGAVVVARKRGRKPKPRMPDLQQRLDGLNEQYSKLSKENVFLRNKLKVLERVVPYRDESVGFLTQLLSSAPPTTRRPAAALASADAVATVGSAGTVTRAPRHQPQSPMSPGDSDTTSVSGFAGCHGDAVQSSHVANSQSTGEAVGSGVAGGDGDARSGARRCTSNAAAGIAAFASLASLSTAAAGLCSVAPPSSTQQQQQGRGQQSSGTPTVLALCPSPDGGAPPITLAVIEELKRITPQDFRLLWKHVCLQLGVLVAGAEVHGPGSSSYVRLERFLGRALGYMDKITLLSPACFVHSMYTNVETGQPERPPDNFWMTCARALQLSQQQLREVISLAAVYEHNVIPVVQQRLQLGLQLSTRLAAATSVQKSSSNSGDALTAVSSIDELAAQLERNVMAEHRTHWDIGDFLCSSVLTPLQVAKALSIAFPYIPDGVAMLHAFKLISAQEDAAQRAAASNPSAQAQQSQQQVGTSQAFPSLADLLVKQIPALAAGLLAAGGQASRGSTAASGTQSAASCGGIGHLAALYGSLQQVGGGTGGAEQLAAVFGALQQAGGGAAGAGGAGQAAVALAKLAACQPPAQLQQVMAGLQAAVVAARTNAQPAPPPTVLPMSVPLTASMPAAAPAGQLQGFAALRGALAAVQQAGAHTVAAPPDGSR